MKQSFFVFLLFILFPFFAFPQSVDVEGKITNAQNKPLENAHVHIGNHFVLANDAGVFYLSDIKKKDKYHVRVTFIGYQSLDTLISLEENTVVDFKLKKDITALGEVLLTENTERKSSKNIEKVDQNYLLEQFSGSLAETLDELPGVNAIQIGAGASKPIIRGLGFNRVVVTENGIKQEGQQWGADHGLEIDALSVERIEIIKGAGTIAHGSDAIGGVIKIINDLVPEKGLSGHFLGLGKTVNNTIAASLNLAYRKDDFFYKIKATGSEFGDYSLPTNEISYLNYNIPIYNQRLKNTAGKEVDLYGQIGYLGNHYKGTLSLSNVYFKSGFFPGSHGVPSIERVEDDGNWRDIDYPFQRVNHLKAINKNEWFFHGSSLEVILGFQNNHRQEWSRFHTHYSGQEAPETNPDLELDFSLNTFDVQAEFSKDFSNKHSSSIGFQNQFQINKIDGYSFLLPEYSRFNSGLYATHSYWASEEIKLNVGARLDFSNIKIERFFDPTLYDYLINSGRSEETANQYATRSREIDRDFTNFNFMGGMLYNFYPNWDFSLNAGTSFRLPTAIELGSNGIHHGSFRHERGNQNLDAEKGYVFDTNLNYTGNDLEVYVSPYLYYFDNYIFLNPSGEFSFLPHAGQIYNYTQSRALLTGVEFDIQKRFLEKWRTKFTFEYLYNRQITNDKSRNYPLPFTPPINGFGEVGYSFTSNSKIFEETEFFLNTTFALDQDRIAQNEEITPGYQIFGGGFRTDLKVGNFKADINLQVSNLFNTKYFNHMSFYRALEIPEMGRNIQLMIKVPIN